MRTVTLKTGEKVPVLGLGTWRMGERESERAAEVAAIKLGLELGIRLIDTAEMYGEGGAEEITGEAMARAARRASSSSARSIRTTPRAKAPSPPASAA